MSTAILLEFIKLDQYINQTQELKIESSNRIKEYRTLGDFRVII